MVCDNYTFSAVQKVKIYFLFHCLVNICHPTSATDTHVNSSTKNKGHFQTKELKFKINLQSACIIYHFPFTWNKNLKIIKVILIITSFWIIAWKSRVMKPSVCDVYEQYIIKIIIFKNWTASSEKEHSAKWLKNLLS